MFSILNYRDMSQKVQDNVNLQDILRDHWDIFQMVQNKENILDIVSDGDMFQTVPDKVIIQHTLWYLFWDVS
jgi:hypothetical protein